MQIDHITFLLKHAKYSQTLKLINGDEKRLLFII